MKKLFLISALLFSVNGWAEDSNKNLGYDQKYDFQLYCVYLHKFLTDVYLEFNQNDDFGWLMLSENFDEGQWKKVKRIEQPDRYLFEDNKDSWTSTYSVLKSDSFRMFSTIDLPTTTHSPPIKNSAICIEHRHYNLENLTEIQKQFNKGFKKAFKKTMEEYIDQKIDESINEKTNPHR